MNRPNPMAGGFFLVAPIIAGFVWGLATNRAVPATLVGFGIGLVLALAIWLIDRSRTRRRP